MGSPTALADKALEDSLKDSIEKHGHGLYVPSGALWGGEDIRKMADRGTLKVLVKPSTDYVDPYGTLNHLHKIPFHLSLLGSSETL